jgi:leucyl/phenylalanyl-tRNA--protein transferase
LFSQVSRSRTAQALFDGPATWSLFAKHYVGLGRAELPDPNGALRHPDGLAGVCRDVDASTLMRAYASGLFPADQRWWAPAERMVSFPETVAISKALSGIMRTRQFAVTFDEDFAAVVASCAEGPCRGRDPSIHDSFAVLHDEGHAHSVEVWGRSGQLLGGLYGLAIGRAFFTEGTFSLARGAANAGFVTLSAHLERWGFVLNDGKRMSGRLSQLGFKVVPRAAFNALLERACTAPGRTGKWAIDHALEASPVTSRAAGKGRVLAGRTPLRLIHGTVTEPS